MPMKTCSYCHKETRHLTHALCPTCYARYQRNGTAEYVRPDRSLGVRECSYCASQTGPFIKSLCRACYQRQYQHGTPDRVKVRNLCQAPDCNEPVTAHGLCTRHIQRVRRHGDVNAGRPEGWGAKRKHPMYEAWQSMRRGARLRGGNDPRWDDFWVFLSDMGERPEKHRLSRKDETKPFSKENCEWVEPILGDQKKRDDQSAYMRALYVKRPDVFKRAYLKRHYNLPLEVYEEMLAAQGGVCAICKRGEKQRHKVTGEIKRLAVDHCHKTGKNRQLLCTQCNHGLGNFNDDIDLLQAAIDYLRRHAAET